MRLTCFGIVLVLAAGFFTGRTNAQIPERALFQPGSYAYGAYQAPAPTRGLVVMQKQLVDMPDTEAKDEAAEEDKTVWEQRFGGAEKAKTKQVEVEVPVTLPTQTHQVPYLAYHRNPINGRIHVIPYQKGYVGMEDQFPKHQSQWNLWLSSLPCREQNRPQIQYLGYYDPMPEILQDKPSRMQLLLGYPNPAWTSCCDNRWGYRMAQCPGVEVYPQGPPAEPGIRDQICDPAAPQSLAGAFRPYSRQQRYPGMPSYNGVMPGGMMPTLAPAHDEPVPLPPKTP